MHLSAACAVQTYSLVYVRYNAQAHVLLKTAHSSGGIWYLDPHELAQTVFAQLTRAPNTNRHTDHATCDICSNRSQIGTVCGRCGLKIGKFNEKSRSPGFSWKNRVIHFKQGVTRTGRYHTGPPCCVGRPTAHVPGPAAVDRSRARRPTAGPPTGSVTDDDDKDRQQTPASKTILTHWAGQ